MRSFLKKSKQEWKVRSLRAGDSSVKERSLIGPERTQSHDNIGEDIRTAGQARYEPEGIRREDGDRTEQHQRLEEEEDKPGE